MKSTPPPPRLQCPHCKLRLIVAEVFDHCAVSWPNQRWLGFACMGDLDGAPGPAFFPKNSARVPGLTDTRAAGGMTLRLGRRRWRVRARG